MSRRKRIQSLREWRTREGLSQREAAARFRMSQGKYSKLELGQRYARGETLRTLAAATGVPLDILTGVTR